MSAIFRKEQQIDKIARSWNRNVDTFIYLPEVVNICYLLEMCFIGTRHYKLFSAVIKSKTLCLVNIYVYIECVIIHVIVIMYVYHYECRKVHICREIKKKVPLRRLDTLVN